MELQDLKDAWKNYDEKLDKIEQINRQILENVISSKTERKLFWMKIQSVLGILTTPILMVIVIIPFVIEREINFIGYIGVSIISIIFLYSFFNAVSYYKLISIIKPAINTILETKENIAGIKRYVLRMQKERNIIYPFMALSLILMISKSIDFKDPQKIAILIIMIVGIFFWGNFKFKIYFHDKIELIDKEINEIEELKK